MGIIGPPGSGSGLSKAEVEELLTEKSLLPAVATAAIGAAQVTEPKLAAALMGKLLAVQVPEIQTARAVTTAFEVPNAFTIVYLQLVAKAEKSKWTLLVDGKVILTRKEALLTGVSSDYVYSFIVKPKGTWELKMEAGVLAELLSSYQEL